jgi:hypothetical protein
MTLGRLLLVLPLLASTALAELPKPLQRGDPVDPLTRFTWLRELAGSCWRGASAEGTPADTQCYSIQYGQFVRATTTSKVPRGARVVDLEVDSVLAWDPRTGNLEIFSWSSDGSFRRSEATLFKGVYRFQDRTADGSPPVRRTIWRRQGPDGFAVTLERRDGDRWVEVKVVEYQRVRP